MSDEPLWKRLNHTGFVKPKDRVIGEVYTSQKGVTGIWDGKMLRCEHYRQRKQCKECGGSQICEHDRQLSKCKECGGSEICEHNKRRSICKECGGIEICEHNRYRSKCKDCVGECVHGNTRTTCQRCKNS